MRSHTPRSRRNSQRTRRFSTIEQLERREVFAGFETAAPSYLVAANSSIEIKPLVTVGDGVAGYQMVGIPDGMGAFDNGDGTFTVLMNHELGDTVGAVREHGSKGAFVSKWTIDKSSLSVLAGEDLISGVKLYNASNGTFSAAGAYAFRRLCSADLPAISAFYNPATGLGTQERIFMNGEETGNEGKAFGTVVSTGIAQELPHLGKFSWENSVASPYAQNKTIVIGMDDTTPGQVYVYVGQKTSSADPITAAGLLGGNLFGIKVAGLTDESRDFGLSATGPNVTKSKNFDLQSLGNVAAKTGAELQADSVAAGVTNFLRPEDGSWDPNHPNDFYFVTTDRFDTATEDPTGTPANQVGHTRLYRLRFNDITQPENGGQVEMLSDGIGNGQMFDNITVDHFGNVMIQEDPGNQPYLAKIWQYNIASGTLSLVAEHNPSLFATGQPNFLTQDEESSGIIDLSEILGRGYYLTDVQAHKAFPVASLAEYGQFQIIHIQPAKAEVDLLPNGLLSITGTDSQDRVQLTYAQGKTTVRINNKSYGPFAATSVSVQTYNGSDTVTTSANFPLSVLVYAGQGNDYVTTGAGRDDISTGEGNDRVYANDGDNIVHTHGGDDFVRTGSGRDFIFTGAGDDEVFAGSGHDVVYGDAGKDRIWGESGNDYLTAGDGDDLVFGGSDLDMIEGGNGQDQLFGQTGHDVIVGGLGADWLYGESGNDLLISEAFDPQASSLTLGQLWMLWATAPKTFTPAQIAVTSDSEQDSLFSGSGEDWFIYRSASDKARDINRGLDKTYSF